MEQYIFGWFLAVFEYHLKKKNNLK